MTTFLPAISDRYSNERGLKITGRPSRASISAADGGIGESVFGTAKPSARDQLDLPGLVVQALDQGKLRQAQGEVPLELSLDAGR